MISTNSNNAKLLANDHRVKLDKAALESNLHQLQLTQNFAEKIEISFLHKCLQKMLVFQTADAISPPLPITHRVKRRVHHVVIRK